MVNRKLERQRGREKIAKQFRAGEISQREAQQRIRNLSRVLGGGGGVSGKSPQQIKQEAESLKRQQEQEQSRVRKQLEGRFYYAHLKIQNQILVEKHLQQQRF